MGPKGKANKNNKKAPKEVLPPSDASDSEPEPPTKSSKRSSGQAGKESKSNAKKSKKSQEQLLDEVVDDEEESAAGFGSDDSEEDAPFTNANSDDDDDDSDEDDGGITLAERLEALTKSLPSRSSAKSGAPSASVAAATAAAAAKKGSDSSAPTFTTSSLVTLLTQALQSSDDNLLEQCLLITNPDTISTTCQQLPVNFILIFLKKLVNKFEKRPSRGILVSCWISSLLTFHYSYLTHFVDFQKDFSALKNILLKRSNNLSRLASLKARLSYVLTQGSVDHAGAVSVSGPDDEEEGKRLNKKILTIEPLAVYEDQ